MLAMVRIPLQKEAADPAIQAMTQAPEALALADQVVAIQSLALAAPRLLPIPLILQEGGARAVALVPAAPAVVIRTMDRERHPAEQLQPAGTEEEVRELTTLQTQELLARRKLHKPGVKRTRAMNEQQNRMAARCPVVSLTMAE